MNFDKDEFKRWMKQAEYTLESAEDDLKNKKFSWCCFKAQQSAEYAVKGLLYGLGSLPVGHSVASLLMRLKRRGVEVKDMLRNGRLLDRHYIPTRYPNAHPEGAPYEFYDKETAEEALVSANRIIQWVKKASGL